MHYAKIHFGDYARDTGHLTLLEHGIYLQLMRLYYTTERPLTADLDRLCRAISARSDDERKAVSAVLEDFFTQDGDGWHQKRIDAEIAKFQDRSATNSEIGKLGGRPKKPTENPQESETVSNGNPQITLTTNHKPLTKKKHSATANAVALPDWLPQDAWDAFVETRVRIRAPLTDRAKTLAVRELSKLRDQGHDCRAVLEQSVLNGWRGLFAPKGLQPKARDQFEGAL